ncbi:DNA mismatch repair protein MutT [Hyphomicrobium methylovorum]|uniref:NUDIX domain-containing protein n=1 Tax=Hyphomicrobium methylovorum TaxID=84 RepID=UPI0015E6C3CC|nr:NUDIX domain-containing protein [Hyphomicrobium methylovorum]MBA2126496.1 DNA mismatch repair protein MutT [Hyphomicrobium methylovorum]
MLIRLASYLSRRADRITLGVQGVVADETGSILLVRHGYRPGWHFPGGGVERGETVETALARELNEETGVSIIDSPRLFAIYTNFAAFPGDHVALFIIDRWQRDHIPKPNAEIVEQRFFARDALPPDITPGAARRLGEIFGTTQRTSAW